MSGAPTALSDRPGGPLVCAVRDVLSAAMGVPARWTSEIPRPLRSALLWLAGYAAALAAVECAAFLLRHPHEPRLFSLLVWGGCYFALAIFLAQSVTQRIIDTVEHDIVPYASANFQDLVAADLLQRHCSSPVRRLPYWVATAATVLGALAVSVDIGLGDEIPVLSFQLALWVISYFLYFLAAAQAVIAARFYLSFARCLGAERSTFYIMRASDTPLVKGIARVSGLVLAFWVKIFLAVLSIILLAAPLLGPYRFAETSLFLFLLIPIAGSFSLGFGSLVYLESERRIRSILRRFACANAAKLQDEINSLMRAGSKPEEIQLRAEAQERILGGSHYGSQLGASASMLLSVLVPIASCVQIITSWLR